ncbi:MAG: 4-hydroxyphenylpyruvate dioxygenase [Alphaproteobacteria bacterium]|nr:MAG: 4-hydroxyphenylpyruvate dioxygenase [Alphaproteobacteria bacterium]
MGTDGFEFIEYASPDPKALVKLFEQLGFVATAKHKTKKLTLYKQGDANFILNEEPTGFAAEFAKIHGPCVCSMAFRVKDAAFAHKRALELGAKNADAKVLDLPAIKGIGDSLIYFVDQYGNKTIYDADFVAIPGAPQSSGIGLKVIDHLTHNVYQGRMDHWKEFYERLFNFREIRYFDIKGQKTGLFSRALTSPDGKIRIPINESADDKSQIAEYLKQYNGEGIQHIALSTDHIYDTVEGLRKNGVDFMTVPETYYELVEKRLPNHGEDLKRMQKNRILIDGVSEKNELLLQIFTNTVIGPIFFEIIQRKGNDGFGEGNFKALFESIELDQMRRGVI